MATEGLLSSLLPLAAAVALLLLVVATSTRNWSTGGASNASASLKANLELDESVCECTVTLDCSAVSTPVLGGVDFVQYFTDFKLDDGTYNETAVGLVGSEEFESQLGDYTFRFLSQENKDIFDASPEAYIPAWGGFCAWGVAAEVCPPYPWSADCLGPSGNWGHWTIQQDRLFFFFFEKAKSKFLADPDTYIAQGDARWQGWFGADYRFSTNCYVKDPNESDPSHGSHNKHNT